MNRTEWSARYYTLACNAADARLKDHETPFANEGAGQDHARDVEKIVKAIVCNEDLSSQEIDLCAGRVAKRIGCRQEAVCLLFNILLFNNASSAELKDIPKRNLDSICAELENDGFIKSGTRERGTAILTDECLKSLVSGHDIKLCNQSNEFPMPCLEVASQPIEFCQKLPFDFCSEIPKMVALFIKGGCELDDLLDIIKMSLCNSELSKEWNALKEMGYMAMDRSSKFAMLVLCAQFIENGTFPYMPTSEDNGYDVIKQGLNTLAGRGIAIMPTKNKEDATMAQYILSADAVGKLFKGRTDLIDYTAICSYADIEKAGSVKQVDLVFSEKVRREYDSLAALLEPARSQELARRLEGAGRSGLSIVFHGGPGTGKTEAVRQIARRTGRDIFYVDPARLLDVGWGDSEKNVRGLFMGYRYLSNLSSVAPIFLMNEADSFLSRRVSVYQSIDKSENTISNIILQELEKFDGIFVATTNLERNLDPAFERRLLFKISFTEPDETARRQIWAHKCPKMPSDLADSLSKDFAITGAQIDNVIARCVAEEFLSGVWPSEERMRELCRDEMGSTVGRDESAARTATIGFRRENGKQ